MQTIFDCLIDSFVADKVGLADNFLSVSLAADLKENLIALYADNKLLAAGIGNNTLLTHDKLLRSDKIYWLDKAHENPFENRFFELMDSFVSHLNSTCYTGMVCAICIHYIGSGNMFTACVRPLHWLTSDC